MARSEIRLQTVETDADGGCRECVAAHFHLSGQSAVQAEGVRFHGNGRETIRAEPRRHRLDELERTGLAVLLLQRYLEAIPQVAAGQIQRKSGGAELRMGHGISDQL